MKKCLLLLSLFVLQACSPKPFLDSRREIGQAGTLGEAKLMAPVFCYNPYFNSKEELQKMAQDECEKYGKTAVQVKDNRFTCTLVSPHKVFFECQ